MTLRDYFECPDRPDFFSFGRRLDALFVSKCGLGVLDLPDQDYSSLHEDADRDEDGRITEEAIEAIVDEVLEQEGF